MKKVLIVLLSIMFLTTGCGKKEIKYEMANKNNYIIGIQIKGSNNKKIINMSANIKKYNDEINISYMDINHSFARDKNNYFIFDKEYYLDKSKEKKYVAEKYLFSNYNLYLEGLKNIDKKGKSEEDIIGKETYKFIPFTLNKKAFKRILEDANIDMKIKGDVEGFMYTDPTGYLYKIIYKYENGNDNISINCHFTNYGKVSQIYTESIPEVEEEK